MQLNTTGWFKQDPKVTIHLEGATFPIKDTLEANGFKFERPITGPTWYKVVDNTNQAINQATLFLKDYKDMDIEISLVDGEPNY